MFAEPFTLTKEQAQHNCAVCGKTGQFEYEHCPACLRQMDQGIKLAEAKAAVAVRQRDTGPLTPEVLVPRLGERLVEMGLLGDADLHHALWVQRQRAADGESVFLGHLLVELGYISRETLDAAAIQQARQLQEVLQESNRNLENRVRERTNQLQDAMVKLAEFTQMKADFVANVSHELRTPLAIMTGYADMMSKELMGPLTERQASALDEMGQAGERLSKIIEDLLSFSEATIGSIPLQLAAVSLEIPVRRAFGQSRACANDREISLRARLPRQIPRIKADTEKITWVIGEFLRNAIKFTPPGGAVWLRATPQQERVQVTVSDTGVGIPEERIEEAFRPFHQLDSSMTRQFGGTGLGLALARRILEAHGSAIAVRSMPGHGSHFAFSLPIAT